MQTTDRSAPADHLGGQPPKWLTPAELADELRVTADQTYRLLNAGRIAGAEKFGKLWRINRAIWEASRPTDTTTNSAAPAEGTAEAAEGSKA